ncbi:hypothetical protein EHS13_07225 [Paenibacillus psychroresistens]|uniref:Asp/Glu/hydantoin racemase n=1 Tax=Paenibacillus psychroresistens TaxID=1778678 RepID=A0A6B8RGN4_9BACL|nr:hypothetical protein [Paenibacillus psychroresistens]QGQ94693.1 hypothetical protein EHS13_07225 [Paenibacillus psychroresistens]
MKTKIGCLHAHYSNIAYIQNAFSANDVELVHFVDPGLMIRIAADKNFDLVQAQDRVIEQIEWIAKTNVDAILITCTNYIALLDEDRLKSPIPIIKLDEPFFEQVCKTTEPQVLLFTNPATVEGTIKRLHEYASAHQKPIDNIEVQVIEHTFEMIMLGEKARYENEISSYIRKLLAADESKVISVVQLSMVDAAEVIEREMNVHIGNPLKTLVTHLGPITKG